MRRALWDLRWHIAWYSVGLALYGAFIMWLYPSFEDTLRSADYPSELLDFFGAGSDLSRPTSFMTLEYQSFVPLVLIIYAVVASTGLVAGEEGRGALETVLAQPISRTRFLLEKAAAFVLGAVVICAVLAVAWLASVPFIDLHGDLTLRELWAGSASTLPVICFMGALGFYLGAIAPSRGLAAGILTVVAIESYALASFARAVTAVEWMRYLSPYYYTDASTVLDSGIVWWHAAVLLGGAAVVFGFALLAFRGREIGAGVWQARAWMAALAR
jgi:ABC-2 type transport system permease protein